MDRPDVPPRCPHCGNTNPALMGDNGLRPSDPAYTLLCMRPCGVGESSFDDAEYEAAAAAAGTLTCGMQWEPNGCRTSSCTAGLMPGEVCESCGRVATDDTEET